MVQMKEKLQEGLREERRKTESLKEEICKAVENINPDGPL